jgi:D-lactate dehydrogenase (cytochrome)
VVTAEGKVIRTAAARARVSAGYDLTRIFVGSEGTLGVITEIDAAGVSAAGGDFRRHLLVPERRGGGQHHDRDDPDGHPDRPLRTARRADGEGGQCAQQARPARAADAAVRVPRLRLPASKEQAEAVQEIARDHGAQDFQWATTPEERTRLWTARHNAYFACLQLKPGCRSFTTDVCVPISRLAECIERDERDTRRASCRHRSSGTWATATSIARSSPTPTIRPRCEEAERLNQRIVDARAAHGRHLHRRARRRPAQDGLPGRRAR